MKPEVLTIPRFDQIPFVTHGFGNAAWTMKSLKRGKEGGFALLTLRQVHSDVVHFIDEAPRGSPRGDALITRLPGLLLIVRTADCLPVLLADEEKRVVAAVHCGWKGTRLRLLRQVVLSLAERVRSDPSRLLVAFGPSIGAGCYEVGEDVRRDFSDSGFPGTLFRAHPQRPGKYFFDLREANRRELLDSGVRAERIFSVDVCTHCDPSFLSHRRDREETGRMLSFIGLSRAKRGDLRSVAS